MVDVIDAAPVSERGGEQDFATQFGTELRRVRRERGLRRGQLASDIVPASTLKAVERGRIPLSRPLLTWLASAYEIDLDAWLPGRPALTVTAAEVVIDGQSEPIAGTSITATLRAYLRLVAAVRPAGDSRPTGLRRGDIKALADHLDLPCATVVSRLAELMDAGGAEARAMIRLYLGGASVVGVTTAA